ncbi:MAG TPA: hypothetical protein VGH37_17150 [Candidatus Acidoferrum sp.]
MEAGAGETDAHYFFTVGHAFAYVDDFAMGFKVGIVAADGVILAGNADFEIAADGYIEAGAESGAAAA